MAFNDGVKAAPIAYIGLVSVIVTFIIVLLLQVVFFGEQQDMLAVDQATQGPPAELADLTAKQLTQLTKREMVDRERGVVTIGISRAMELVVKELAAGKTPAEVMGPQLPATSPAAATSVPATSENPATGKTKVPAGVQPPADSPRTKPAPTQEKKDAARS